MMCLNIEMLFILYPPSPPPPPSHLLVIEDDEGVSKGYGFVRFIDEEERNRSYSELDRAVGLGRKAITIKPALAPKQK